MTLKAELSSFDENARLLSKLIDDLSQMDEATISSQERFIAEAVMFRLFRIYERLTRAAFLAHCVSTKTPGGKKVKSKLRCKDWDTAESIIKAGNKFLDWGNVESVRRLADLVFEDGFPMNDILAPIHSSLVDLQRFRNYVAHDSKEAQDGFKKAREQFLQVGDKIPTTVGDLALYRKRPNQDIVLKIIHKKVSVLSDIVRKV